MRIWILAPLALGVLATACGETKTQKATTGAAGGAVAGAVVGGPVGAVVGAGVGAAGGAYREELEQKGDRAVGDASSQAKREMRTDDERMTGTAERADNFASRDLTNEEVRRAQTALKELGLYDGEIDGIYGRRTIRAVSEFQAQKNMRRTGALDARTQQELHMAAADSGPNTAQPGQPMGTGQPGGTSQPPFAEPSPQGSPEQGQEQPPR